MARGGPWPLRPGSADLASAPRAPATGGGGFLPVPEGQAPSQRHRPRRGTCVFPVTDPTSASAARTPGAIASPARSARIAGARLSVDSRVSEIAGCVSSSVRLLLSAQCHRGPSLSSQPAGFRPLHGPGDAVARAFHGSTHPPPVDAPGLPRLHCGGRMGGGEEIEPVTPTTVQVTEGTAASRGAWTSFARNRHRGARHL